MLNLELTGMHDFWLWLTLYTLEKKNKYRLFSGPLLWGTRFPSWPKSSEIGGGCITIQIADFTTILASLAR